MLNTIEEQIKSCNDEDIMRDWNYLQASDHFYYMCTKWFSDGDVHRYFNPYPSPYEAFINYMNVLSDFMIQVEDKCKETWDDVKDYSLDDIVKMSNTKVKELIKSVDMEELAHAMKDAKDEVRDKIIPNMTKTAKKQFDTIEEKIKNVKKSDLKEFKDKIESELRNLWKK